MWVVVALGLAESVFSPWDRSLNTGMFGCDMKRRTVLQQAGAVAGALGVAGCLSDGAGSPGGDESSDPTATSEPSSTEGEGSTSSPSLAVASSSVETRDASCGSEESASVSFAGSDVSISGSIPASDPCHEAVIANVSLESSALTVNVEAVETDSDACQQCLAAVEYGVDVAFEGDGPNSVTVQHESDGETTVVTEESR